MSALEKDVAVMTKPREWKAALSLSFSEKNQRTVLSKRQHIGPLVVQRPFYPEGAVCHVYLIHPPGGVVGGDALKINIELENNSHVLITTPSAGKFYRCGELTGSQSQQLELAEGALLEWFPQENIFFNGCNSVLHTQINLTADAMFCGWEINCLGRPAANEQYRDGRLVQHFRLTRDNKPLFSERNEIKGSDDLLTARCGLHGHSVFANLIATSMDKDTCQQLQDIWHERSAKDVSITLIRDVLVCRYLGDSAEQAKSIFSEIWSVIRMKQKNLTPCKPRIWNT